MKRMFVFLCLISFIASGLILAQDRVLKALKVTNAPVVDGVVDQVWQSATDLNVPLGETYDVHNPASIMDCSGCHNYNSSYTLKLKAVYTTERIYVLAKWTDSTASFTRNGSWDFSSGSWTKPNAEQSEDRIALFFPIGEITGNPWNTKGCMAKCHTYYPTNIDPHVSSHGIVDDAWLESGKADMWHSKAGRGTAYLSAAGSNLTINPITHEVTGGTFSMTGYIDDKWVGEWAHDSINGEDGGRYGDAGGSGYSHNRIGDKSRPKYMETSPTDFADAMVLKDTEIANGECVGDATTGVSDADASTYWTNYAALNAIVPERILKAPTGSRGDIDFGAVWNNNEWTAEFSRALQNGNDDDVQFDVTQKYTFGSATFENSRHGYEHRTSKMDTLIFDTAVGVEDISENVPDSYSLLQNFPNPFNPSTMIEYQITKPMRVKLNVYDVQGRFMRELVNEEKSSGSYFVIWDGKDNSGNLVASGTYFYKIQSGEFIQVKKMTLLK
ncbi:MAG: hypothetical protein CO127_11315 [Ignavibacteria bacterium CG_4_9_14_3_um_filter_36_18]|nr:MAG: hypothetical protein CO127_11315 [Ignavibacteria bacterium CG_4_9_14_3_um_filter_36_18]